MTEKRFTHNGIVIVDHLKKDLIYIDGDENLLDLVEYVDRLQSENEQLKQRIKELEIENEAQSDLIFFQAVWDILMKYQHLFNREMADEVLEDLGIELPEWFE